MSSARAFRPATSNSLRHFATRAGAAAGASQRLCHVAASCRQTAPVPKQRPVVAAAAVPNGIRRYSQQLENRKWTFEEVQKLAKQPNPDVVIVDVREPGELQSTGHIPHAVNVPITTAPDSFHITADEFTDRFGYVRPEKDQEVLFYCKSGVRSRAAAGLARDAGWTRVGEYPGSWLDWAAKGGDVAR
ncbi:unnamed protein product [Discula destructiva]